jgi:hypothetical protein
METGLELGWAEEGFEEVLGVWKVSYVYPTGGCVWAGG